MQYSHPFETSMVSSILDVILKITASQILSVVVVQAAARW